MRKTATVATTRWLTPREAAELIGFSVNTLNVWRCLRQGPPYKKVSRSIRYSLEELHKWMESKAAGRVSA